MIEFIVLKQSNKSRARLGLLCTPHGDVETPALVPVATQAVIKTLTSQEVLETKSQLLIANTFHLHLKPGEVIIKRHKGLHTFMHWPRPLMTDSGGYQVFSLGFGSDYSTGKILKQKSETVVQSGQQPQKLKITDEGVWFRSPVDGTRLFIGPRESIKIQEALGAEIIFAFDECTPPLADYDYTKTSLEKTHRWAKQCLDYKTSKQALFGIVQGGKYKDLRQISARLIGTLPFDGFGIGGEFGDNKKTMTQMLRWALAELPSDKPRHLLGIGHLEDIPRIIKEGVDIFDCTVPTHYARHGVAFTSTGKLTMSQVKFLKDKQSLDRRCGCNVCQTYSRGYICHLLKAKEITALRLLTFHNLYFFNSYVESLRQQIRNEKF